jgi:hypothetical protein
MADLITLDELKAARGIDPTDTSEDATLASVIPIVSSTIRLESGRDFGSSLVTETREFIYDDTGFIDIDDAQTITAVELVIPNAANVALTTDQWRAMPPRRDDNPTYWYIMLAHYTLPGFSPEMGFARNIDVMYREGRYFTGLPQMIAVTGTWGWPEVPEPVKLAAVWTIEDWLASSGGGEELTSESIEGFSRSWGGRGGDRAALSLPSRARSVLAYYEKIYV